MEKERLVAEFQQKLARIDRELLLKKQAALQDKLAISKQDALVRLYWDADTPFERNGILAKLKDIHSSALP